MNLVHLDGVEHGCCGPAARADAAEVARDRRDPVRDRGPVRRVRRDGDRRLRRPSTRRGRTPNPCARCNGEIKFGAFLRRADELRRRPRRDRSLRADRARTTAAAWRLLRGADRAKGPELHAPHARAARSSRDRCSRSAGMPKAETRAHAERFGLPVAAKPDSQELCFAPDRGRGRVRALAGAASWCARARSSTRTGGCSASTTGRSRSRSVSVAGSGSRPASAAYVVDVDAEANRVVVGPEELLARRGLVADRVSWVAGARPGRRAVRGRRPDPVPRRRRAGRGRARRARTAPRGVPRAAARGRARAERGRLPGRRDPRRRPDRRRRSAEARRRRPRRPRSAIIGLPRLDVTDPGREAAVKLLAAAEELRHPGRRTSCCTSRLPTTSPRSPAPRRCRSGSSSSPTPCATRRSAQSKRRSTRPGRRARRSCARWSRRRRAAGVGPMFTFRGAVTDQVGRFLARSMLGGHRRVRRRLLHQVARSG